MQNFRRTEEQAKNQSGTRATRLIFAKLMGRFNLYRGSYLLEPLKYFVMWY
jgi:hypothetical protein